jgi:Tfp pilus assembly protein PilF/LysM repeat protein
VSLVNKMLQDLESRQNPQAQAANKKSVYEDLKSVKPARFRAPSPRLYVVLIVIAAIGAGANVWRQWGDRLLPGAGMPVKAPPMATRLAPPKPAVAQIPTPVSIPAPTSTVAAAAPTPALAANARPDRPMAGSADNLPAAKAPAVIAAQAAKDEIATRATPAPATPQASPRAAKSSPAAGANGGYWIVARGDTVSDISSKSGIDLVDLSKWNNLGRGRVIRPGQRLRLTPPAASEAQSGEVPPKAQTEVKRKGASKETIVVASADKTRAVEPAKPAAAKIADNGSLNSGEMDKKVKPLSADDQAESEYRLAVNLLQKGRPDDAEKHFRAALNISPEHAKARELLAGLMLQNGHWREAEQNLEQGIDKVPAYYPFAQLLARIYVEHGSDQKALATMEGSREAGSGNADFMAFLALLYQRTGNQPEAIKAYTEALKLDPQEGRSWLGLGISFEAAQDWSAAGAAYQRAIESGVLDDRLLQYARQRQVAVKNK